MSRKIRTLLFSTLYPSEAFPSRGIFVENRLRHLLSSGAVETRVVAPVPWFFSRHPMFGRYARLAAIPRREQRNGIEILHPRYPLPPKIGLDMAPFLMALGCLPTLRRLRREGFDFDLIDAHFYYPDGAAAAILARLLDKPLVATARGTDLNLYPRRTVPRKLIQWTARRAHASVGVCRALCDQLDALGADPEKLVVLRNGVDLRHFRPLAQDLARRQLDWPAMPTLLAVGHLIERKGHHVVIEALAALPGFRLVIVGAGRERAALQRLAQNVGVADRVCFVGDVPHAELVLYYSAADILVLASSREGWANVLLEAMACGTPAVASAVWGTPEVLADPAAGRLVAERTPAAFAAGIVALWAAMPSSEDVRAYAEGFSWEATTKGQIELFRGILASAAG